MFRLLVCTSMVLSLLGSAAAKDPIVEGQERLDNFFAEMDAIRDDYEVAGRQTIVRKPYAGEIQATRVTEDLFRKISGHFKGEKVVRFEIRTGRPIGTGGTEVFEHNLYSKSFVLHGFDTQLGTSVRAFDRRSRARMDPMSLIDPFYIAGVGSHVGFADPPDQTLENWNSIRILKAKHLPKKRMRLWVMHKSGLAVVEVTFAGEPKWLIESMRSFANPGEPVNYLECDYSELRDWKLYSSSRAEWHIVDEMWLPHMIFGWHDDPLRKYEEESELVFANWRFGNDIRVSLLDRESFASQEVIASHIDFEQLSDDIRKTIRRKR